MPKKIESRELTLGSIQYVHDPEAARKWFDLYVEILKEEIISEASTKVGQTYISKDEGEGDLL